jgi:hypothetical protein
MAQPGVIFLRKLIIDVNFKIWSPCFIVFIMSFFFGSGVKDQQCNFKGGYDLFPEKTRKRLSNST